ncbi:MAG: hypothetical protein P8N02_02735 [Actinomycetota bacterium]|nr:hypothetical protein [Actinomycetota bacterium]
MRLIVIVLVGAMLAAACSSPDDESNTIRILTHDDFHLPEDALAEFTERTGVEVVVFRENDPTAMADLLDRSRSTPIADVVLGIDTLELTRVINDRLVESYRPLSLDTLSPDLLVEGDWMTPVSFIDACLNRSVEYYLAPALEPNTFPDPEDTPPPIPSGIGSFLEPEHAPTLVLPDARTSRMGLYFLVALARLYPENTPDEEDIEWPRFLDLILRQGSLVTDSWETAYFSHFLPGTGTAQDAEVSTEEVERSVTWGSAGMPAVSVRFQPDLPDPADVDIAVMSNTCIRIVHYAGLVAGTPNRLNAGRLIDAMAEPLFQFGVPDRFGSRPARPDILSTDAWREFGVEVDPAIIDPVEVGDQWPVWQLTWNQVMNEFETGEEPIPPEVTVTLPN